MKIIVFDNDERGISQKIAKVMNYAGFMTEVVFFYDEHENYIQRKIKILIVIGNSGSMHPTPNLIIFGGCCNESETYIKHNEKWNISPPTNNIDAIVLQVLFLL